MSTLLDRLTGVSQPRQPMGDIRHIRGGWNNWADPAGTMLVMVHNFFNELKEKTRK
jgi:hypothetical protein